MHRKDIYDDYVPVHVQLSTILQLFMIIFFPLCAHLRESEFGTAVSET
jgi:hypothetical protein